MLRFTQLILLGLLGLSAACGGQKSTTPTEAAKGTLRISSSATAFDTATGGTEICAHFTLQPYTPAADGTPQLAGAPVSFDSTSDNDNDASASTDQILGCIDDGSGNVNWGYIVTADTFSDCGDTAGTLGAALTNVYPTTTTINVPVRCEAGVDNAVPIHVQVAISQPDQAGYVDISAGVDATDVQIGCKQADVGMNDGLLHFGESFIATDGTIPQGLVGLDFGTPTQFGGTVDDPSGDLDTYYTGDVALGQVTTVYQTFLSPCASGAEYADTNHAQCVSDNSGLPAGTSAELADAFAEAADQGFAAVSISAGGLVIYSSMSSAGPNIMNAASASFSPSFNVITTTPLSAPGYTLTGVFIDQSTALQFLIAATDGGGNPVFATLSYNGTTWTLSSFAAPTAADISCNGLYSAPAQCFTPTGCTSNSADASFHASGDLITPRILHTATLLNNGLVLIAGGVDSNGQYVGGAELFDSTRGAFVGTGTMVTSRYIHTATTLQNGQVLIAGGSGEYGFVAQAELYDPASGAFTGSGSLITPRSAHTATLLNSGLVLIAGGANSDGYAIDDAELYDPMSGSFTTTGSLHTARENSTATLLNNGDVLIAGGDAGGGSGGDAASAALASAELYDPTAGTFTPIEGFAARKHLSATLLKNGDVLIAAGSNGDNLLTESALYGQISGAFSSTGSLLTARVWPAAILLNSGRVLVVGGLDDTNTPTANAEVYDPTSGAFTATGSLVTGRYYCTATLLDNGDVLVAGGVGAFSPAPAAELYY